MISAAVTFQMNGLGSSFQWVAQSSMAASSSETLVNTPRRRRRSVSSLNQRSMRLVQELDVGVKCRCQRRRSRWEPRGDLRRLVCGQVVQHDMDGQTARDAGVDLLEEPQDVLGGMAFAAVREDLTGRDVHRREQVGGAVALVVVVIVPARPGTIGRLCWVRSIAWHWVFSSKLNTTARLG